MTTLKNLFTIQADTDQNKYYLLTNEGNQTGIANDKVMDLMDILDEVIDEKELQPLLSIENALQSKLKELRQYAISYIQNHVNDHGGKLELDNKLVFHDDGKIKSIYQPNLNDLIVVIIDSRWVTKYKNIKNLSTDLLIQIVRHLLT